MTKEKAIRKELGFSFNFQCRRHRVCWDSSAHQLWLTASCCQLITEKEYIIITWTNTWYSVCLCINIDDEREIINIRFFTANCGNPNLTDILEKIYAITVKLLNHFFLFRSIDMLFLFLTTKRFVWYMPYGKINVGY